MLFRSGVPYEGKYTEILNTDDERYGGLGRVNGEAKFAEEVEIDGKPYSFKMMSAPLSASIFTYTPYNEEERKQIARKKRILAAEKKAEEAKEEAVLAVENAKLLRKDAEEAKAEAREAEKKAETAEKKAAEAQKKAEEEQKKAEAMRAEQEA